MSDVALFPQFPESFDREKYIALFNHVVECGEYGDEHAYMFIFGDDDARGDYYEWYISSSLVPKDIYVIGVMLNAIIKNVDYLSAALKNFGQLKFDNREDLSLISAIVSHKIPCRVGEGDDIITFPRWDDANVKIKIREVERLAKDTTTDDDPSSNTFTLKTIGTMIKSFASLSLDYASPDANAFISPSGEANSYLVSTNPIYIDIEIINANDIDVTFVLGDARFQTHLEGFRPLATEDAACGIRDVVDSEDPLNKECISYINKFTLGDIIAQVTKLCNDHKLLEWTYDYIHIEGFEGFRPLATEGGLVATHPGDEDVLLGDESQTKGKEIVSKPRRFAMNTINNIILTPLFKKGVASTSRTKN